MTELTVIPNELTKPELYTGIAPDGVASLQAAFAPHFVAFHSLADEAGGLEKALEAALAEWSRAGRAEGRLEAAGRVAAT